MNGICVVLSLSFGAIVAIILWHRWLLTDSPYARSVQVRVLERLVRDQKLSGVELSRHLCSSSVHDDYVLNKVMPQRSFVLRMFHLGWLSATPVKGAEAQTRSLANSCFRITPDGLKRLDHLVVVTS